MHASLWPEDNKQTTAPLCIAGMQKKEKKRKEM
jgi:hypothetical protein